MRRCPQCGTMFEDGMCELCGTHMVLTVTERRALQLLRERHRVTSPKEPDSKEHTWTDPQ